MSTVGSRVSLAINSVKCGLTVSSLSQVQSSPCKFFAGALSGFQLEPSVTLAENIRLTRRQLTVVVGDHTPQFLLLAPADNLLPVRDHIGDSDSLWRETVNQSLAERDVLTSRPTSCSKSTIP